MQNRLVKPICNWVICQPTITQLPSSAMSQPFAIQLDNVSKTFGRGRKQVEAVRLLSLEVSAGQVFGFLGPNGAGKSTTIRMMMDLIRPSTPVAVGSHFAAMAGGIGGGNGRAFPPSGYYFVKRET
jgi:ABC-type glutathione transport system ATPase component